MTDVNLLTERLEAHRGHLRAVAYRMLGSLMESDDAVLSGAAGQYASRARPLTIVDGKIVSIEVLADPDRLRALDLSAWSE